MRKTLSSALIVGLSVVLSGAFAGSARASDTMVGVGANYWRTVDKIPEGFDRDGLSWLATYRRNLGRLLALQADLEWFPAGFAVTEKDVFSPQGFLLAGGALYAGLGIGILYSEGEFNDKPYYAVRAGLDMEILPKIHLDIHANYHFSEWDKINRLDEEVRSDTITMGAALRIGL